MQVKDSAIAIRAAILEDAPGLARVHVRSWQHAYRGILPDSFLDALEPVSREERWRDALLNRGESRFTFVAGLNRAPAASEIVGFASGGPERDGLVANHAAYDGEIYALYLAPEYQRQGIGRWLVGVAGQWLIEHGTKSIVIWALEDNRPARAFYELLGGVLSGEKNITIGPSNLVDVAYGWPDARDLVAAASGAPGQRRSR